jgi:hypothetical protein
MIVGFDIALDAIRLAGPRAQIDEFAAFAAERAPRIGRGPFDPLATGRAQDDAGRFGCGAHESDRLQKGDYGIARDEGDPAT